MKARQKNYSLTLKSMLPQMESAILLHLAPIPSLDIQDLLHPLEKAIHQHLIPALTGREACSVAERDLLTLPVRLGGMGLVNPMSESTHAFEASKHVTAPLVALIVRQELHHNPQTNDLRKEKNDVKKSRRERQEKQAKDIVNRLNPQLQRSLQLAQEKGSSSCLTVLPIAIPPEQGEIS